LKLYLFYADHEKNPFRKLKDKQFGGTAVRVVIVGSQYKDTGRRKSMTDLLMVF
jgi:hypothetical protein